MSIAIQVISILKVKIYYWSWMLSKTNWNVIWFKYTLTNVIGVITLEMVTRVHKCFMDLFIFMLLTRGVFSHDMIFSIHNFTYLDFKQTHWQFIFLNERIFISVQVLSSRSFFLISKIKINDLLWFICVGWKKYMPFRWRLLFFLGYAW